MYSSDGRGSSFDDDEEEVIGAMGCHLTWLELHGIDKRTLDRSRASLEAGEPSLDARARPSRWLASLNLLGFVYYSLGLIQEAEEKFRQALAADADNVNAVGNLTVILRRQSRMRQYRESLGRLRALLAGRQARHLARAYAGRAFALRHFQEHRRCFTYMSHVSRAVELGEEAALDVPERAEWLYDYGLALRRRYTLTLESGAVQGEEDARQGVREVVDCFHKVTQVAGVDRDLQALAWFFIGELLALSPGRTLGDLLPDTTSILSADECVARALALRPESAELLARWGAQLGERKQYERARELLDKSLLKEATWLGFTNRGLLSLKMYEDATAAEAGTPSSGTPATTAQERRKTWLETALSDFTSALEIAETHDGCSDLGYVHFLLGQPGRALQLFSSAVGEQRRDDSGDPRRTHERWARVLRSMGEEEGAALQLDQGRRVEGLLQRRSAALEQAWKHRHGVNCQGFECDLARFDYCSQERTGYVNVLAELGTITACDATNGQAGGGGRGIFKYDFFVSFSHIDNKWAVALLMRLEKEFGLRGNIRYRDYQLGAAIAENISESVTNSYRTLIIMSPDSLRDQWCRYEVQRGHMTNLQRRCVVPIMLRPCLVPRELEHLTFIKCQKGQFKREDWHRLGQSLRQQRRESKPDWLE